MILYTAHMKRVVLHVPMMTKLIFTLYSLLFNLYSLLFTLCSFSVPGNAAESRRRTVVFFCSITHAVSAVVHEQNEWPYIVRTQQPASQSQPIIRYVYTEMSIICWPLPRPHLLLRNGRCHWSSWLPFASIHWTSTWAFAATETSPLCIIQTSKRVARAVHHPSLQVLLYCWVGIYLMVWYSTVQYSTVQYSTVQYSTVQYSKVQHSTVQ